MVDMDKAANVIATSEIVRMNASSVVKLLPGGSTQHPEPNKPEIEFRKIVVGADQTGIVRMILPSPDS
jgi:hypothetical protein